MSAAQSLKLIKTEDGSSSLYHTLLDETYHSIHGAIQESQHVFIEHGLQYYKGTKNCTELSILEYGFGTGLNALLTLMACPQQTVYYESIDKYPVADAMVSQLNFGEILGSHNEFAKMHTAAWNTAVKINNTFLLQKLELDFREYRSDRVFDIIYFDAFSPNKQPELWQREIFSRCYEKLLPKGILVTYSAKGQLKRDLKAIGFSVESLPGPPGKFEMTRATK